MNQQNAYETKDLRETEREREREREREKERERERWKERQIHRSVKPFPYHTPVSV